MESNQRSVLHPSPSSPSTGSAGKTLQIYLKPQQV